jgi:Flp pilus assembly protein TadD
MTRVFPTNACRKKSARLCAMITATAALCAAGCGHRQALNPNIATPAMAVEALGPVQSVYYTLPARDFLQAKRPELVSTHDSDVDKKDFIRAQQDPALWRQLDHKYHFDAVILCGSPVDFHNLLEHLVTSKDWTMTYLDHTSLIYKRVPAKGWTLDDFHTLQQGLANYTGPDRAAFLTGLAEKLLAIGQPNLAKQELDQAMKVDEKSPETWTQMGLYDSQTGRTTEALQAIDKALELAPDDRHILATKAQILYSAKRFQDALAISGQLVKDAPDDTDILFFHAKIAHEAGEYKLEIPTMKHMIDLLAAKNIPTASFRIYLAQAYARNGQADSALEQFQQALSEGGLSDDQKSFIDDTTKLIRKNNQ